MFLLQGPRRHRLPRVDAAGPERQLSHHGNTEEHRGAQSQDLLKQEVFQWSSSANVKRELLCIFLKEENQHCYQWMMMSQPHTSANSKFLKDSLLALPSSFCSGQLIRFCLVNSDTGRKAFATAVALLRFALVYIYHPDWPSLRKRLDLSIGQSFVEHPI